MREQNLALTECSWKRISSLLLQKGENVEIRSVFVVFSLTLLESH